ncbi:MAG: MarC family protein [Rhizobiaceae bacterium]
MPSFDAIINAFVTLMVTIDPPGLAPVFLALTSGMTRQQRISTATRATLIALFVLVMFLLAGVAVLSTLGITIHAFRVAGGLLLFYIAFEMIFEKRQERHEKTSERAITKDHIANISAFPLAVPLIAGPGAISAVILLSTNFAGETAVAKGILASILVAVMSIVMFAFILADRIDRYLGATGRTILTRLLGLLLAALSVQFVADGVKALTATA